MSELTPSQTVGPYYAYGLTPEGRKKWKPNDLYKWKETVGDNLVTPDAAGERIRIEGVIYDGDGQPITDAMLEIWQADAQGRYADPRNAKVLPNTKFKGFGRSATDDNGLFAFDTIKPGSRGMLRQVYTRLYFSDEAANASDPVLALVPADRRDTLIAKRESRDGKTIYRFDIRVQGEGETVFFEV